MPLREREVAFAKFSSKNFLHLIKEIIKGRAKYGEWITEEGVRRN